MRLNPLTLIDGYKLDHRRQYPPNTTKVYSNWTPRGSRVTGAIGIIFFGLRYFIQYVLEELWKDFFLSGRDWAVADYKSKVDNYLGPNTITYEHLESLHDLGYLPLRICAFPEGSFVPLRVPCLTIENTHPEHAWLVNYLETVMSNFLWKPCTSATTAWEFRKVLEDYAEMTGGSKEFIDWQGHDFSFRGMSGIHDACVSGAGHLLSFTGTDTLPAIEFLETYYPGAGPRGIIGGSVAATEHSVMCAGGEECEKETFEHILNLYPTGVVSVVSDTWNLWRVLDDILPALYNKIMARDGKLVVRPDSGDPVKIICGDPDAVKGTLEYYGVIEILWHHFGGTTNAKGYRTLDPHIGAIYGDSINLDRMKAILNGLAKKGYASDNIVFGIGSYTYEYVTRDTYGFAMKATYCEVDGEPRSLFKSPVTDSGEKHSARGRLAVLTDDEGSPVLVCDATPEQEEASLLQCVWENGEWAFQPDSLWEIRERVRAGGIVR